MSKKNRLDYKTKIVDTFNPIKICFTDGDTKLVVIESIMFNAYNKRILIDRGFESDGASVKWYLSMIVPRLYGTATAAVVHDAIYRDSNHFNLKRWQADEIFRVLLYRHGNSKMKCRAAWLGVRFGGWRYWKK